MNFGRFHEGIIWVFLKDSVKDFLEELVTMNILQFIISFPNDFFRNRRTNFWRKLLEILEGIINFQFSEGIQARFFKSVSGGISERIHGVHNRILVKSLEEVLKGLIFFKEMYWVIFRTLGNIFEGISGRFSVSNPCNKYWSCLWGNYQRNS